MFHQELWSYILTSFLSQVLESAVLLVRMDLLLQGLDSMGHPINGHVDSCQAFFFFQAVDLVGQGYHLRELEWSQLFTPSSSELGKLANEGREARLMVFTINPCPVPSPQRSFQRKVKKSSARLSLETYASNNLSVSDTWLIFQKEVVFKQGKIGRNP
jgi:hypothetical protein